MIIEFLIIAGLAFWLGWRVNDTITRETWKELLKDLGVTDQQLRDLAQKKGIELAEITKPDQPELPELEVRLEKIGDCIYAYSVKDDQFLGQGQDRDKLIESLTHNLTNVRVTIAKEHGAELLADKT